MKKNTNFQIVKNTILSNPTYGKKHKKDQLVIAFRSSVGGTYRCTVNDDMLNYLVGDILKCPVLSNVSLSEPLPQHVIMRLMSSLSDYVNLINICHATATV